MRTLTEKATQDAAAVKVLTIMTLVYLPATVVSVGAFHQSCMTNKLIKQNFFSTSFVHQVQRPDSSLVLTVTSNWWIFLAASLPLTVITLYAWWFYVQKQAYGQYPAWWRYLVARLQLLSRCFSGRPAAHKRHDVSASEGELDDF